MNISLCKYFKDKGGTLIPLILKDNRESICNPSLLYINGKLYCNIRKVGYILYYSENEKYKSFSGGKLCYYHKDNEMTLRTDNILCELDPQTLNILSSHEIDMSNLNTKPKWTFVGLEDIRLIYFKNNIWAAGVRRDTEETGIGRIELSRLEINENSVREKERRRIEIENKGSYCEKNWMPIKDQPGKFIKWANPTEIVEINEDINLAEKVFLSKTKIPLPFDLRGGSQLIPFEDGYLAVVHECDFKMEDYVQRDAKYYHRFIIWNKDWSIRNITQAFNLLSGCIEFACGLEEVENNILISFGYYDNAAYILKVPTMELSKFIENNLVKKERIIDYNLNRFVENPFDPIISWKLAVEYEDNNQKAAAIQFYLRCVENTEDKFFASEALLRMTFCLQALGNRQAKEYHTLKNSINTYAALENTYIYCLFTSYRGMWKETHDAAEKCLENQQNRSKKYLKQIGNNFEGLQSVKLLYAIAKQNLGLEGAGKIYNDILEEYHVSEGIFNVIQNNLTLLKGEILDNENSVEGIPKIIIQTWETYDISDGLKNIANKWYEKNPSYFYEIFNKEERQKFIDENFDENVKNAYKYTTYGPFKADIWRYCFLYKNGGFYVDLDTICECDLDNLIKDGIDFIAPIGYKENEAPYLVSNGFIGVKPEHPIMKYCLEYIVECAVKHIKGTESVPTYFYDYTGAGCLGRAINKYLNRESTESFKNLEGIHDSIMLIPYDTEKDLIFDLDNNVIIKHKNADESLKRLYREELEKLKIKK